jgi:hypothetical protein
MVFPVARRQLTLYSLSAAVRCLSYLERERVVCWPLVALAEQVGGQPVRKAQQLEDEDKTVTPRVSPFAADASMQKL